MNSSRFAAPVLGALFCTGLGLLCGWVLTRQDHAEADAAAAADDAEDAKGPVLSALATINLGIETQPVEPTRFVTYRTVTAEVTLPPEALRPLYAPAPGTISSISVRASAGVRNGAPIATIARDPLPKLRLDLTADVLRPAQETRHEALVQLRQSASELEIAREEYERVRAFTEGPDAESTPLIPRARTIELGYALRRAEIADDHARHELLRHGLSESDIDGALTAGHLPAFDGATWLRALGNNGLWPAPAGELLNALPEARRSDPWVVATIGELAARGRIDSTLITWVTSKAAVLAPSFEAIGAMLIEGAGIAAIEQFIASGALSPSIVISAPAAGPGGWSVDHLDVRAPGARVERGNRIVTLRDSSTVRLRCSPVGDEVAAVEQAIRSGAQCRARPLIEGDGPNLKAVVFTALVGPDREHEHGAAYADVPNQLLALPEQPSTAADRPPSWQLRPGQRYAIEVPQDGMDNVVVLPTESVVADGSSSRVFVFRSGHYDPIEVRVLHRDARVAVIPARGAGSLASGMKVVTRGALALQFALRGPADAGGHGHGHGH